MTGGELLPAMPFSSTALDASALAGGKVVNCDVAVPLDKVGTFLDAGTAAMARLDPEGEVFVVSVTFPSFVAAVVILVSSFA